MPLIPSDYNPPFLFKNGHFSTIYAGIWRKIDDLEQKRERIELSDGDFLDLDWSFSKTPTSKLVILIHGVEGNAQRAYITGSAKQCNLNGYDTCAINLRGCSGEENRLYRSYHAGATEDIDTVVHYILATKKYSEIIIKGFSLGGNLTLKYLGEQRKIPQEIRAAIAISVPCDLYDSQLKFLQTENTIYAKRFKKKMVGKLRLKQKKFSNVISEKAIDTIATLKDFDDIYTSISHGFTDAIDYYTQNSCLQFLPQIKLPTLIINAKNDSFLGEKCYPYKEAKENANLYLEIPKYGGHVGFYGQNNITYTEKKAIKFLNEVL